MSNFLSIIGRHKPLFNQDVEGFDEILKQKVSSSKFLVLGGAGTIGKSTAKEIFKRNPKLLHVVDISENNLVELVRDLRSSIGYIDGEFATFALDIGSREFDAFMKSGTSYDYVLNLSALKHVRSEKDIFTLMRMINVNVTNTNKTILQASEQGAQKYFCVSTDKAANPVNMMGASKRIMELFLMKHSESMPISTARFANVAFSDGSLLHGFNQRLELDQPIVAPNDVRRYFVTPEESGQLCLFSCLLGENRDIFFPKLSEALHLITFSEIAENYLRAKGFEPYLCESEDEARDKVKSLPKQGQWPCLFTPSNTTGEKDFEEFFTESEVLDMERFAGLGVIKNDALYDAQKLAVFESKIEQFLESGKWQKAELVELFQYMLPDFEHQEKGKYLDSKM